MYHRGDAGAGDGVAVSQITAPFWSGSPIVPQPRQGHLLTAIPDPGAPWPYEAEAPLWAVTGWAILDPPEEEIRRRFPALTDGWRRRLALCPAEEQERARDRIADEVARVRRPGEEFREALARALAHAEREAP